MKLYLPCAKVNLGLKIIGRRKDSYHEISSLVLPLPDLHDELEVEEREDLSELLLECDCKSLSENNILQKTYDEFSSATAFRPGLVVKLKKNIPIGAGLGGGSSDAACLLLHMASLYPQKLSENFLKRIALKIGADVPFFLKGKVALMTSLGEKLEELSEPLPHFSLLLVWPELQISTAWAFKSYDEMFSASAQGLKQEKNLTKLVPQATQFFLNDKLGFINLQNDLELPLFKNYPLLESLSREFINLGAQASGMSGSGSSIYGIFLDSHSADIAAAELIKKYKFVYRFFI